MGKKKSRKFTVKTYKTMKGRKLFFIKSKTYIRACCFNRNLKLFKYKSDDPRNISCSIRFKYSIEDVKLAEKEVTKEKSKKKKLWSWLFVLLNIVVVGGILWYQLAHNEVKSFDGLLALNPDWKFLVFAVLLVIASQFLDSSKTCHLLYYSTHRFRPFLSYKSTGLCRYYDALSPMSSGGEPFQIFYMKNRGVRGDVATSIPIVKSLFWQISYVVIGIFLLTFNAKAYISSAPIVVTIAWISIICNLAVLLVILLLSVSKRVGPRIVIGILKLLSKMHIIKNYQLTFRKVMRFVINYQNCMRAFASHFFTVLFQILLASVEIFVSALVPYFIYRLFVPVPVVSMLDIITKTIICNLVSLIIPIPGGSGTAELSFLAMFTGLFPEGTAVWAMLIWRTLTHYSVIIRGISITIYDAVYGNKKSDRLVKSGYFTEKYHFALIKKRKKISNKEDLKQKKLIEEQMKQQAQEQQTIQVEKEKKPIENKKNITKTKSVENQTNKPKENNKNVKTDKTSKKRSNNQKK